MKNITIALVAAALALTGGSVSAEPAFRFQEGTYGKGRLQYIGCVPVLLVQGSPDEIGEQVGALALKQIGDVGNLAERYLGKQTLASISLAAGAVMVPQFPRDHLTELNAAAKAADWDRNLLIFGNTAIDLRKGPLCSALIVEGERSATQAPLIGRNLDWGSSIPLHEYTLVTVYRPEGKHAFASIGFPGMIGCASGMNDAGLVVAANTITEAKDGSSLLNVFGTPQGLLLRRILEECTTIDEAERLTRSLRRTTMASFVVCDKHRGAVFEVTTKQVVVRHADDHLCYCTNHFRTDPLKVNLDCDRYETLATSRELTKLSVEDVIDKMDAVAGDNTLQTMVFQPSALNVHLAFGEGPASQFPLQEITLSELFQQGEFPATSEPAPFPRDATPPEITRLKTGKSRVTFRFRPVNSRSAKAVYLAGSFNDWKPTELKMDGPDDSGLYQTTQELEPGRYEYKFVIDGKRWRRDLSNEEVSAEHRNSMLEINE